MCLQEIKDEIIDAGKESVLENMVSLYLHELSEKEEILLLTQKKVMKDYWSWTASRSFFQAAAEAQKPIEFDEYDYDMTQVEDEPENPADKQQPTE